MQFALVGTKLFYSANDSSEVKYVDTKTGKCRDLDLKTYKGEMEDDFLVLSACSPHQSIRASHKSTLDYETMKGHSEKL